MQTELEPSIGRELDPPALLVPAWKNFPRQVWDLGRQKLRWKRLRQGSAVEVAGSFGLSLTDQLLRLALGIVLGRLLGVEGYGAYAGILSSVSLLLVLGQLGLDRLILREVPRTLLKSDWGAMRGVIQFTRKWTWVGVCLSMLLAALVISASSATPTLRYARYAALLLIPALAFLRLDLSVLRGLHRVLAGQVAEKVIQPVLFLGGIGAVYLVSGRSLGLLSSVTLNVIATVAACFYAVHSLRKCLPKEMPAARSNPDPRSWTRIALPMFFSTLAVTVNLQLPILMVGWLADNKAVGLYAIANRGLLPITLVMSVFSTTMSSRITKLYFAGRHEDLQQLMTRIARSQVFLILPAVILLLAFGHDALRIFGRDFASGYPALVWLLVGQLGNALTGAIGTLLMLSGHERQTLAALLAGVGVTIVAGCLLIPAHRQVGGAMAAAISVIIWNIGLSIYSIRKLRIDPTVLGLRLH